jgi:acetate kinase
MHQTIEGRMNILVLNAGSSTVKFSLFEADSERLLLDGLADWAGQPPQLVVRHPGSPAATFRLKGASHDEAVTQILDHLAADTVLHPTGGPETSIAAIGNRVVHGGSVYTSSVRVTPEVKTRLAELTELAPLHNPVNLEVIEAAERAWPGVPQVAVFDTAFHATLPQAARTYAIPYAWTHDWGLRRYGFHGLSHAYCAARAAQMLQPGSRGLRLVICHLGNGCSASAVRDGRCVDTSMGFTPLEGLVMGTRSGSVDPGLLLYVLRQKGVSADDLDRVLNRESGLLGISGVSGDMRQVHEAARAGNPRAVLSLEVFVHRLRQTIGAFAATLGGIDALIFTAGIGEHDAAIRAAACRGLEFLGLHLDDRANAACQPDADIAAPSSPGRILVIATREDLTILRETARVLRQGEHG